MRRLGVAVGMLVVGASLISCAAHRETVVLAEPAVEIGDGFNNISRGGQMYFAGQPTTEGLAALQSRGVKTVISIRTPEEHAERVEFDEQAEVERLGMRYVNLPMTKELFTPKLVEQLAEELRKTDAPILLHCGSSNRVGTLWATYLVEHEGYDLQEAIEHGKGAGITRESSEQAVGEYLEKFGK